MKNEIMSKPVTSKKAEIKTWASSIKKGDMSKRVEVEKLDNEGFLVTICVYGTDKAGKYIDKTKKYYSDENPLEPQEDPIDTLFELLSTKNK